MSGYLAYIWPGLGPGPGWGPHGPSPWGPYGADFAKKILISMKNYKIANKSIKGVKSIKRINVILR